METATISSPTDPVLDADSRLETAIAAAQNGDFAFARAAVRREVEAWPDELRILHRAGVVSRLCGDHAQSLDLLHRALAVAPRFHYTEIEIGNVHDASNEPDEALRWYRQAMRSEPSYPVAYLYAARLERARGESQEALRLMEQLYEYVPDDIAGNLLRAELLRQDNRLAEAADALAAAMSAGCEDPAARLDYLNLLGELGDYRGILNCVDDLAPNPRSAFGRQAITLAGHARLALEVDDIGALFAITNRQRSSRWLSVDQVAERISSAVRDAEPLSLICLNDADARFLALGDAGIRTLLSDDELACIRRLAARDWFGETTEGTQPEALSAMLDEAFAGADILGVDTTTSYQNDLARRGYAGILQRAVTDIADVHEEAAFTAASVASELHRRSPYFAELLSGLSFMGYIGPRPGLTEGLAARHRIPRFLEYLVPASSEEQAETRFNEVLADLIVPRPGALFLVDAGLPGRIYCHRIRQLGGIAIDIGATVEAWDDLDTEPTLSEETDAWMVSDESMDVVETTSDAPGERGATRVVRTRRSLRSWLASIRVFPSAASKAGPTLRDTLRTS